MTAEPLPKPTSTMPGPGLRTIITPDQRLRVFVSSTLQELAEERQAAKRAIENLRLSPVMFELGARPHAPRDLYRAYLEQSHIFVGIYWQRYGWVAPGEEISGLEDEYLLSGRRPKLMYVKQPAAEREPRLKDLLLQIQQDDQVSYKPFRTARELQRLIEDDLALLLTERFTQAQQPAASPLPRAVLAHLPVPATPLIGREREVADVCALFERGARLVTLSGPGGIGKTRLGLEVARRLAEAGQDVVFVPLAALGDAGQVAAALARALGLHSHGAPGSDEFSGLEQALRERDLLLLFDNFEQVIAAAPLVSRLLAAAPNVRVLVTSRTVLRLVGEYEYPVPPLGLPAGGQSPLASLRQAEAVQLFMERARSVRPDFELTLENGLAVAEICYRLDGLPLAIELAAARIKLFSPQALLARLDNRLNLLKSDARDMPERQRTLRSTIDWSYDLLSPDEQHLFALLGLFVGGASFEAIEAVCAGECGVDLLEGLASLVDKSLIDQQSDPDGEGRFVMLETIRTYAAEKLAELPEATTLQRRHAATVLELAERAAPGLRNAEQLRWLAKLDRERGNLRAAFERSLALGDVSTVARLGWAIWDFWWVRGYQNEGRKWLDAALEHAEAMRPVEQARALYVAGTMAFIQGDYAAAQARGEACLALAQQIGDGSSEALAFLGLGLVALYRQDFAAAEQHFQTSLENFQRLGSRWATAHALHYLWRLAAFRGEALQAVGKLEESARLFRQEGDRSALVLVLHNLALVSLYRQDAAQAESLLHEGLAYSRELNNRWYVAYCLEGFASLVASQQDGARAAQLFGAADALRSAINAPQTPADAAFYAPFVTAAVGQLGAEAYQQAFQQGRRGGLELGLTLLPAASPAAAAVPAAG